MVVQAPGQTAPCLELREQFRSVHIQGDRELFHHHDGRISRTTFEVRYVSAVDVGLEGEALLTPAFGRAQAAQVTGKAPAYIHSCHDRGCRLSIYRL